MRYTTYEQNFISGYFSVTSKVDFDPDITPNNVSQISPGDTALQLSEESAKFLARKLSDLNPGILYNGNGGDAYRSGPDDAEWTKERRRHVRRHLRDIFFGKQTEYILSSFRVSVGVVVLTYYNVSQSLYFEVWFWEPDMWTRELKLQIVAPANSRGYRPEYCITVNDHTAVEEKTETSFRILSFDLKEGMSIDGANSVYAEVREYLDI